LLATKDLADIDGGLFAELTCPGAHTSHPDDLAHPGTDVALPDYCEPHKLKTFDYHIHRSLSQI